MVAALAKASERFAESSESEPQESQTDEDSTDQGDDRPVSEQITDGRNKRTRTWARAKIVRNKEHGTQERNRIHLPIGHLQQILPTDCRPPRIGLDIEEADDPDEPSSLSGRNSETKDDCLDGSSHRLHSAYSNDSGPTEREEQTDHKPTTTVSTQSDANSTQEEASGKCVEKICPSQNEQEPRRRKSMDLRGRRMSMRNLRRIHSSDVDMAQLVNSLEDVVDVAPKEVRTKKSVTFRRDAAIASGVFCTFLDNPNPLSPEDIDEIWYTGQNYKDFRNVCIKETLTARENEEYTTRFHRVWELCDTDSSCRQWQNAMSQPHTKNSPNPAVMLAKARYRGFEREIFPQILVRYRKFSIKYVVREYRSYIQSNGKAGGVDIFLREASEKCTEPFRRYARLIAEGDSLLVSAWDRPTQQSRRTLERTYSGLSVLSESVRIESEANNPVDERKDLLMSLKSSGSSRMLLSKKKEFDNPALR